jgi:hypothetical protein
MSRRLSLAVLSMVFFYGLSIAFAPQPALAANCDVSACIGKCEKRGPNFGTGHGCTSWCLQTMEERKKKGLCSR